MHYNKIQMGVNFVKNFQNLVISIICNKIKDNSKCSFEILNNCDQLIEVKKTVNGRRKKQF